MADAVGGQLGDEQLDVVQPPVGQLAAQALAHGASAPRAPRAGRRRTARARGSCHLACPAPSAGESVRCQLSNGKPGQRVRSLRGGSKRVEVEIDGRSLSLSNLDKVLYPEAGFTKGHVIDYYSRVAHVLLPHLRGRPLTLKRYPERRRRASHFYEKQCPAHRPDWVPTATVYSRSNRRDIEFCVAEDLPTLVWLANLADLELHTSLALAADPAIADDPRLRPRPRAAGDRDRVRAGGALRCARRSTTSAWPRSPRPRAPRGCRSTCRSTRPAATSARGRSPRGWRSCWSAAIPSSSVSEMRKSLRTGKVFVDWSQNAEHKTTVCVYSLRAMAQPTVSTPLRWEEVEAAVGVRRPRGAGVHVRRRARARGRARRPVRARRRAGAGAPGLERSGRGLDAALEVGEGVDRAEVDVRTPTSASASSPEMPVMITREPSRRSAATVPSSCPATRESISGTPVTSITTTRARRARTSASSRSSIWWARSSSSAPMIGSTSTREASCRTGVESSRIVCCLERSSSL